MTTVRITDEVLGRRRPSLLVVAGPCVIEGRRLHAATGGDARAQICERHGVGLVFKASFDKANRIARTSFRGPGLDGARDPGAREARIGRAGAHRHPRDASRPAPSAEVADVLQIPAFLCRQTDLLVAAAATGRAVNVKKGQFLAP